MFIEFETDKSEFIVIDVTEVKSWDKDSLVRYASDQLGVDYVDWKVIRKLKDRKIANIDWRPLKVAYRQEWLTLKRPPRKFFVSI
ncbi:MAG: hypothetical protein RLZZ184_61 [Cyanobacteriota bacterium]|jgi:hypothetical protein